MHENIGAKFSSRGPWGSTVNFKFSPPSNGEDTEDIKCNASTLRHVADYVTTLSLSFAELGKIKSPKLCDSAYWRPLAEWSEFTQPRFRSFVDVQNPRKRFVRGCEKFMPGPAWL